MPFNSLAYFIFLPVVVLCFYLTKDTWRWLTLLLASFVFYAALNAPYLIILFIAVTAITYFAALRIESCEGEAGKKTYLWGGVAANLLILVTVKCLPFVSSTLGTWFVEHNPVAGKALHNGLISIGVSFYVFQAISYLADVYLEKTDPEKHFGYFSLYMGFFPKLLQGPIERAGELIPQLHEPYRFNYDNFRLGMLLFTWGLYKKVVVADRLDLYVNWVYSDVHSHSGISLALATYAYAIQLFCDFSGYTDMALGAARLFNINLTQNFNAPYLATSIFDFWRRWHISFSRWILDYLFAPLQLLMRDWKKTGAVLALMATFLLSGIWHGIGWGYLVWGSLHGIYMSCSVIYKPFKQKLHRRFGLDKSYLFRVVQWFFIFNIVCFAWIFFRASKISDGLYIVSNLFTGTKEFHEFMMSFGLTEMITLCISFVPLVGVYVLRKYTGIEARFFAWPALIRWGFYYVLVLSIILFNISSDRIFIYQQF